MSRSRDLARQAWTQIQSLGHDPVKAIERAINRAIDEHAFDATAMSTTEAGRYRAWNRIASALKQGPGRAAAIARRTTMDRGNVYRALNQMVAAGIVVRQRRIYAISARRSA